jgi:hypothetical protein
MFFACVFCRYAMHLANQLRAACARRRRPHAPLPLPPGTDSINLPRMATPTATGVQTVDAAASPAWT